MIRRRRRDGGFASVGLMEIMIYSGLATYVMLWAGKAMKPYVKVQWALTNDMSQRIASQALELPIADLRMATESTINWTAIQSPIANPLQMPWFQIPSETGVALPTWVCYSYEPNTKNLIRYRKLGTPPSACGPGGPT